MKVRGVPGKHSRPTKAKSSASVPQMDGYPSKTKPRYLGIRITTNGNHLVSYHTEARITDGGVFYPITPSTEMGEDYQLFDAEGSLNVLGQSKLAIETEGEHAAQGGAIALSTTGKRVVNFTSGQGIVYGLEQYYHAPGKLSTMVLEVSARALTKHALNVHCGHDDIYAALDTGWIMLFAQGAQQAADQALILRKVTELSLTPGINIQDGFLTSHLERTFLKCESELIREYLGSPDDIIECPTEAQLELFGPTRRRVPRVFDLAIPEVGLEPTRPKRAPDFESGASANSATPAGTVPIFAGLQRWVKLRSPSSSPGNNGGKLSFSFNLDLCRRLGFQGIVARE